MNKNNIIFMSQSAILIAIEVVMKMVGLGAVPVGPLNMSFLTVPIAVGAIIGGPLMGGLLGLVFGVMSFFDALSGRSVMTMTFLSISPVNTFILCVVTRILVGVVCGLLVSLLKKIIKNDLVYYLGALSCPLLNTCFFMGYICLVFYKIEYVQNLVNALGAANPLMFVVLLVGFQGIVEAIVCALVGGAASKIASKLSKQGK